MDRRLQVVCQEGEFPWFVSDDATVFEVCTASEAELRNRIASAYGYTVTSGELRLPVWRLALTAR